MYSQVNQNIYIFTVFFFFFFLRSFSHIGHYGVVGTVACAIQPAVIGGLFFFNFFFFAILFFKWRIIALWSSVIFCQTSTRISHRYTHVPSLPNLPSVSLPIPRFWIVSQPLFEFWVIHRVPIGSLLDIRYGNVSLHVTLPMHSTLSLLPSPPPSPPPPLLCP